MNNQNIFKDPNTNWKYVSIVVILALLVGGGIYWWLPKQEVEMPEIEIPEKEAEEKVEVPADWKTYRNEEYGFEFYYPQELDRKYVGVHDFGWPPKVSVAPIDPEFVCEENPHLKTSLGYGKREQIVIDNTTYCVMTASEGAAGTFYSHYSYVVNKENRQITFEFTLRYPNCGAVPTMEECKEEQANFDPNILADQILSTFRFLE